VFSVIQT